MARCSSGWGILFAPERSFWTRILMFRTFSQSFLCAMIARPRSLSSSDCSWLLDRICASSCRSLSNSLAISSSSSPSSSSSSSPPEDEGSPTSTSSEDTSKPSPSSKVTSLSSPSELTPPWSPNSSSSESSSPKTAALLVTLPPYPSSSPSSMLGRNRSLPSADISTP